MTNLASLWSNGPWSPVEVWAELPAPPEQVYAVLSDPETYPEWLVGAQRIRAVDGDFPKPGSGFEHSVGASEAVSVDDSTEVIRAEPAKRLGLAVHAGPINGLVDFEIEPAPGGTSRVCLRESATGALALLMPVLRPFVYARNGRSLKKLAGLLDSQAVQ